VKKRDLIRLTTLRIFELMAEQRTLGQRLVDSTESKTLNALNRHQQIKQQNKIDEQVFRKTFYDYVDNMHWYLDQEIEKSSDLIIQLRLHFSSFLNKLIDSVQIEKRALLFTANARMNLFYLCDKWSGRFSLTQHHNQANNNNVNINNSNNVSNPNNSTGLLSMTK
jgi:hypothetical protein